MTKKIRIENADQSTFEAVVEVWDKGANGAPDTLVQVIDLKYPCSTVGESCFITATRYLVVREVAPVV